ncbi:RDD family protein [Mycoplasmatota bacterium]|nr:RDD family protein [Mycoplasmatota bacterium]
MIDKEKERLISDMTANGSRRVVSRIIDFIFQLILMSPIFIWLLLTGKEITQLLNYICIGIIIFAEFIIPVLTKGKSVGKFVCRLRIISISGYDASVKQLFVRSLFYIILIIVDIFAFGIFKFTVNLMLSIVFIFSIASIFLDIYNRTAWDKLAGVYVVLDHDYRRIDIY